MITQTVRALTLVLACSSQCSASQPLSVFIAWYLPWSTKPFTTLWVCYRIMHSNLTSKGSKPVVMRGPERVLPWRPVFFEHISQNKRNSLCHNCPTHLSCKCPTHLSHKCLIPVSHPIFTFTLPYHEHEHRCVSGVGAPPLNIQPLHMARLSHEIAKMKKCLSLSWSQKRSYAAALGHANCSRTLGEVCCWPTHCKSSQSQLLLLHPIFILSHAD